MSPEPVRRRVAAWLLTLPGPFNAPDLASAVQEARRKFDSRTSLDEFERGLNECGYQIVQRRRAIFALAPLDLARIAA